jgi:hypothetical protein
MRLLHAPAKIRARFDDPNLIAYAGLVPVMALAARCGLDRLAARLLTVPGGAGANAGLKVPAIVAGMVAGADSVNAEIGMRHPSSFLAARRSSPEADRQSIAVTPGRNLPRRL